jgi:hypothetical protein
LPEPLDIERIIEEAREAILDHGHVTHYSDGRSRVYDDLPRAWTTGRTLWERPEMMIVGPFTEEQMQSFINGAVDQDSLTPVEPSAVIEVDDRKFLVQEAERGMFLIAMGMFNDIRGLQLVWLDSDGKPGNQPVFPPNAIPEQHYPRADD